MYTDYSLKDENVKAYKKHEYIINTIKQRFSTYGYERIKTPAFEQYDLYTQVTSAINQNEMIKVIDYTGDVLVLRPDVTIPITRKLAQDVKELSDELRYFYIQDVYRQPFERGVAIENTQAGIEYFGENSPAADAEVIALACQTLMDFEFNDVKVEIGDAGFFQELINSINLTPYEQTELRKLIQAKNAVDIKPFLRRLSVDEEVANTIENIPFLYGNPLTVCKKAKELHLTKNLHRKLDHLLKVYDILKIYGFENKVVMDLGLINHMGYYSDVIFQGFVDKVAEPVLMGGRYDKLANEFGASIPAIGFACKVDELVSAIGDEWQPKQALNDVRIFYEMQNLKSAVEIANELREHSFSVKIYLNDEREQENQSTYLLKIEEESYQLIFESNVYNFSTISALLSMIKGGE